MNSMLHSEKKGQTELLSGAVLLLLFLFLILALKTIDVKPIAPDGLPVGLADLNALLHDLIGVHPFWSKITGLLGGAVLLTAGGFACFGLYQLFTRKSFRRVDPDLYLLAALYILTAIFYLVFELCIVNCRPVLLDKTPEASFPSSHTMLAISIMGSAVLQVKRRIRNRSARSILIAVCLGVMLITVIGRLLSGVHWFTDIIGGILLGTALCLFYTGAVRILLPSQKRHHAKRHVREVPN